MINYHYIDATYHQEDPLFLGRQQELAVFREVLGTTIEATIINVYGTGGIGKSSLLNAFQRHCSQAGYYDIVIEGHSSIQTPASFCSHILQMIGGVSVQAAEHANDVVDTCIQQLNRLNDKQPVVLLIDAYECMESIDSWLREHFLVRLPKRLITVIAGRYPLSEAWYLSPEWRKRLLSLPLSELNFTAVRQFCHMNGIHDEPSIIQLWNQTKGHPLMMAVAVIATSQTTTDTAEYGALRAHNMDFLSYIVERWLREVPGQSYRTIVEAASTLRYFNQDILSHVLDREIETIDFRRLIRYSFVYKTSHGWRIHDLLRNAVIQDLSSRSPMQYEHYLIRIVSYYYERLTSGKRSNETTWFAGELMYYIGGPIPRAFLQGLNVPRYFNHASAGDVDAIKHYLQRRNEEARDTVIQLFDPYSNRSFQFAQTEKQSRQALMWVNLNELRDFGMDCFRIVKDAQDQIVGLAVIIPINERTLNYLLQHPLSASYFQGLEPAQLASYSVPESTRSGWFIHTIDIGDFENADLHFSIAHLMISLVFSGERIVVSPPPHSYFTETLESMLFQKAAHGFHTNYDGQTLSPTYILDTRGDQLLDYLDHMMKMAGIELITQWESGKQQQEPQHYAPNPDLSIQSIILSEREQEVAELLREGLTNAQIASRLHLSEITVKKHLNAMFQKFEVTNRTLLLTKLMEFYWKT
ncbi:MULTISPECIES: LuxR C-terminal-related transcriptional regulator [unclassified Paenibacillus]|uniref:helix-turn-helix transcriptional regulator n=1 Tax=unclassified Paenibacillus TaxID=185978 RepID=UPI0006D0E087|nr:MULTISPECIES: LuxR C-terminal-related transcriptional regulator [unclassified Paenibacillus]